jgi:hypothetical protein
MYPQKRIRVWEILSGMDAIKREWIPRSFPRDLKKAGRGFLG